MNPEIIDHEAIGRLARLGGAKLVHDMIELFFQTTPERLQTARQAVAASDSTALGKCLHQLKPSAAYVGAIAIGQLTAELRAAAAQADWPQANLLLPQLEQAFAAAHSELETILRETS